MIQNNPNWRGKVQPKRERCPKCSKRGLGKMQIHMGVTGCVGRQCRYCREWSAVK